MNAEAWPPLPLEQWEPTYGTLHLWMQILGKTRLALCPLENHFWNAALYVSTRGLTTAPMPVRDGLVEIELDFVSHALIARSSEGAIESFSLVPMSVADFFTRYMRVLRGLDLNLHMDQVPCEVSDRSRFSDDRHHGAYDADAAHRCWSILRETDRVLRGYRSSFVGKQSPVNIWWGSFDLAVTRFSGRRASKVPSGVPYISDRVVGEAYSHECHSVGWWPGGGHGVVRDPPVMEPAYYAYAYPEPPGFSTAAIAPAGAYYHPTMFEWILPYEAVRTAQDPDAMLRAFANSTYHAAAQLGHWDRESCERLAA
jgi:hypothetical protein